MQAAPYGLRVFLQGMPHVVAKLGDQLRLGDVVVSNDPYRGLSHLPDILVVAPVFWRGELRGFAATYQHHTDIGGRFPGGFGALSREVFEEGLCLPIVHFYREGRRERSVHDIIAANVRAPADVLGDLEANAAACRRGVEGFVALYEKYGAEVVDAACAHLMAVSARAFDDLARSIPDGTYRTFGSFDDGNGTRIGVHLALIVDGDEMTIDLTGSDAQSAQAWNMPPGSVVDPIVGPLLGLMPTSDLVVNAGLIQNLRLVLPEGTVVNPRFPAAVASRAQLMTVIADLTLDAFAMALPDRVPAPGEGGFTVFVFSPDSVDGDSPGVLTDIWGGGWGARSDADGVDGVVMMSANGFRTSSAEILEAGSSAAIEGFGYVPDTAGAGRFRGTASVFRRFRVDRPGRVMIRTCRAVGVAAGRAGGGSGAQFSAHLTRAGVTTALPGHSVLDLRVEPGDVIEHVVSAGGGYGEPFTRPPSEVGRDVRDGFVSIAGARRDYGVVVDAATGAVDDAATDELRERSGR
jgi:N-methylhydantoinase B